jgi:stalled ribosome rescue protein Dom34
MRERRDLIAVNDALNKAVPSGFGVVGPSQTLSALERGRVKDLFISERFLREHPDDAEFGVRHARRQGARVVIASGKSASALDAEGGMVARLRYRLDNDFHDIRRTS